VTSKRKWLLAAAVLAVVLVGAGTAFYFVVLRDDAPPPPSISEAAESAADESGDTASTTPDSLDGPWAVVAGPQGTADEGSYVGYRVTEELATVGTKDAVGRTRAVTGTLVIEGTLITEVDIEADLTQLASDSAGRDSQMRQQALETTAFPTASFTLSSPVDLGSIPAAGETIQVSATGDLTLHGATRTVDVALEAELVGSQIVVVGQVPIAFVDYDIDKPQSFQVLSVQDNGTMELQLFFEPA
jgi:polyisoprenoid-binding protein YceI